VRLPISYIDIDELIANCSTYSIEPYARRRASSAIHTPAPRTKNPCYAEGMNTSEAGRRGALATNKKLSKKQRSANARKAAKARWAKKKR
jgi:hypothetical protein